MKSPKKLFISKKPEIYTGFIEGLSQPAAKIYLNITPPELIEIVHLQNACKHYFAQYSLIAEEQQNLQNLINVFAELLCSIQRLGGLPIFEKPIIINSLPNQNEFVLIIPILFSMCFFTVLEFLLNFFNYHLSSEIFNTNINIENHFQKLIADLRSHAPHGTNSINFLKASFNSGIPWTHVSLNVFQFGYGIHSRWLNSSFTDKTSQIATGLARNKRSMSMLLHNAGMPVADQYVINNIAEALKITEIIGFPVVIKPLDLDGGKGVFANLTTKYGVKTAYENAKKVSQNLILEKHVFGKDYRLLVLEGELIWAVERIPAGVIGDGISTIKQLAKLNNEKHLNIFPLRHINIISDTVQYLLEQGYTLNSIPDEGQFVPLNRIANISTGGTPVAVFDKVHPDNIKLAETVAKILRIDLVGIDFISPDITVPYYENGGKIIEVNAQPQLGTTTAPHIYSKILHTILPKQQRIPIIIILGKNIEPNIIKNIQNASFANYNKIAIIKDNTAYLNNEKILVGTSSFNTCKAILGLPETESIIFCLSDLTNIKKYGLPFDRYNELYIIDEYHEDFNILIPACANKPIFFNKLLMQTLSHKIPVN